MPRHSLQPTLPTFEKINARAFGGTLVRRNAREPRPISLKRPMHLVLRSTLATGPSSFLLRARAIEATVRRIAHRRNIRIYRYANAGNHLHLIVLPPSRADYCGFIRGVSGTLARMTLGAERGAPSAIRRTRPFWDLLPFTLIIEWGRQFRSAAAYILKNETTTTGKRCPSAPGTSQCTRASFDNARTRASP